MKDLMVVHDGRFNRVRIQLDTCGIPAEEIAAKLSNHIQGDDIPDFAGAITQVTITERRVIVLKPFKI